MGETAALIERARGRLRAAGARRERLGMLLEPRRILGITRAPRIAPVERAWHLGVLLVTDDAVAATGEVVRASDEDRRGFTAESQRRRAEIAAAARRGGFAEGEPAHVGWTQLDLDAVDRGGASGPLSVREGVPIVRWSPSGATVPLARYLDERVDLLLHPPEPA